MKRIIIGVAVVAALTVVAYVAIWKWTVCYKWCPYGSSLLLQRKTGKPAGMDRYAEPDEKGVTEHMRGPGRHLDLNPWVYSVTEVYDFVVPPGKIGLLNNRIGQDLPPGRFLAGPGEKGTQKILLTPGAWRVNTFGQEPKEIPATIVEPGYVGVQTRLEEPNKGTSDTVLQAGYYNINPKEVRVDHVEIGYRVWDVQTEYETRTITVDGVQQTVRQRKKGTGVSFPLADGKDMHLDFTVVWGIFPENAPRIVREYGTVEMVEQKIIEHQVLSICKNAGSNLTTQQFIEGATREKFQEEVTTSLQEMGRRNGIHFLIALVRAFHPAEDIKTTIQARMLAEEEKATLLVEQARDTVAAQLEEALRRVDVAVDDFDGETLALVEEEFEKGRKVAAETRAQADREVAGFHREAAEINAEIVKTLGQADADVIEAKKKAEATRLQLLIDAYGGAAQYNLATFAESLPKDIEIEYRYAGEGTFWTDAERSLSGMAVRKILQQPPYKPEPEAETEE